MILLKQCLELGFSSDILPLAGDCCCNQANPNYPVSNSKHHLLAASFARSHHPANLHHFSSFIQQSSFEECPIQLKLRTLLDLIKADPLHGSIRSNFGALKNPKLPHTEVRMEAWTISRQESCRGAFHQSRVCLSDRM